VKFRATTPLVLALAMTSLHTRSGSAQEPAATAPDAVGQATIAGRVLDASTGVGVAGAVVYLPEIKRGAITDEGGGFVLEQMPVGEFRWRIQRLGYATWEDNAGVADGDWYNIRLLARPEVLGGIQVVADGFESRRRRVSTSVKVAQREDIMRSSAADGAGVLESMGMDLARCTGGSLSSSAISRPSRNSLSGLGRSMDGMHRAPDLINPVTGVPKVEEQNAESMVNGRPIQPMASEENCLMVDGQMMQPLVYIDERPGSIGELLGYSPDDLFLVEVYARGEAVYAYTQRGVEQMARNRDRPGPVARF
jgi:hypothetical protein